MQVNVRENCGLGSSQDVPCCVFCGYAYIVCFVPRLYRVFCSMFTSCDLCHVYIMCFVSFLYRVLCDLRVCAMFISWVLCHVYIVGLVLCLYRVFVVVAMFISWVLCHVHIAIGFRQMGKPNFAKNTRNAGDVTVLMQIQ